MADRQLLLVKQETTEGTNAAPAATDVVFTEGVPDFKPLGNRDQSKAAKPGVGPSPSSPMTAVYGTLSISVPLAAGTGKGVAPKWGTLMKACGWTETVVATTSVTYGLAADPSASPSVTLTYREGRRNHVLTMGRGRVGLSLDENKRPMLNFTFTGLKTVVADGAILAQADATWTGWNDADPINQARSTFTFAGAAPPFRSLSIEQSDNVKFSDRVNQKRVDLVGDRSFTGKAKIGTLLPSVLNLEALAENNTVSTFSLVHGNVAGKIITINGRFQNGQPSYSDDGGLDVTDADLTLVPSALSTDDDISIAIT